MNPWLSENSCPVHSTQFLQTCYRQGEQRYTPKHKLYDYADYAWKRWCRHSPDKLLLGSPSYWRTTTSAYGGTLARRVRTGRARGIFCDPCPTGGLLLLICWATLYGFAP